MFSRKSFVICSVLVFNFLSSPAYSGTSIYSWQDAEGVVTFSDNPANAPTDARVVIGAEDPDADSEEASAAEIPERPSHSATQGEFAIQLVRELGLGEDPTAEEAADILTNVLIAPRLGQWELDQPMTPELTVRLRKLTVAAAETGSIALPPEQVLIAFDTTAAMLGLTIPVTSVPEKAYDSPYPITQAPPLVYVEPPPPSIYPYYIWSPVAGGFWWNDNLFPGFFVLNVNLFFFNHHGLHYAHRRFSCEPSTIQRHFLGHIVDHHMSRFSPMTNPGRVQRPIISGVRSVPVPNRIVNPTTIPHLGSRFIGSHPSGIQPERRYASPRRMIMSSMIRRQSFPSHAVGRLSAARAPLQSFPVHHINAPAYAPRYFSPSMSHRFIAGLSRGGFGRAPGGGSSSPKTR